MNEVYKMKCGENKYLIPCRFKGGLGKFEKLAQDTLFVIFHGMLLTSR